MAPAAAAPAQAPMPGQILQPQAQSPQVQVAQSQAEQVESELRTQIQLQQEMTGNAQAACDQLAVHLYKKQHIMARTEALAESVGSTVESPQPFEDVPTQ